jgi:hypothetical protein
METPNNKTKLTGQQREEIIRRVLAGERRKDLANEFGVTRQAIEQYLIKAAPTEEQKRRQEAKLTKRLTREQSDELKKHFDASTPEELELRPRRPFWTVDHGMQLAQRLFNKTPSVPAMKALLAPHLKRRTDAEIGDPMPLPPRPHHIDELEPELAKNKEFVAYFLSEKCLELERKEYEWALREWKERNERREAAKPEPVLKPGTFVPRRHGKHAKGRGANFTPPRKKKRKR